MYQKRFGGNEAGARKLTKAGDPAHVYVRLGMHGRQVAHRIIWVMEKGDLPDDIQIDHRDGNPWNNRISNLRLASCAQNQWNRKRARKASNLPTGVSRQISGRFAAHITHAKRRFYIGMFDTASDAGKAYREMALKLRPQHAPSESRMLQILSTT